MVDIFFLLRYDSLNKATIAHTVCLSFRRAFLCNVSWLFTYRPRKCAILMLHIQSVIKQNKEADSE